eukprot:529238_1
MSNHRKNYLNLNSYNNNDDHLPQAIQYAEIDHLTNKMKDIKGPINYEVFSKRYKSNEWPQVNYRTQIWNGTEFKQWTPIFAIDYLFKRLDHRMFNKCKQDAIRAAKEAHNQSQQKEKEKEKQSSPPPTTATAIPPDRKS